MNWADYAILIIMGISALISIFRGFMREMLSLLGWVAAFWVGWRFSNVLAERLVDQIATPSVRNSVAFIAIFVAILLLAGIANFLIGKLIKTTGLSGTDRMLGVLFGVARGAVIIAILVFAAGYTPLPQDPWWQESMFLGHFHELAVWLHSLLPQDYANYLDFSKQTTSP